MIRFSKDKILLLHQILAEATGGSAGVRDEALLDSALESVFAGFGDKEFYAWNICAALSQRKTKRSRRQARSVHKREKTNVTL